MRGMNVQTEIAPRRRAERPLEQRDVLRKEERDRVTTEQPGVGEQGAEGGRVEQRRIFEVRLAGVDPVAVASCVAGEIVGQAAHVFAAAPPGEEDVAVATVLAGPAAASRRVALRLVLAWPARRVEEGAGEHRCVRPGGVHAHANGYPSARRDAPGQMLAA